jgi:hypothetical protein
MKNQMKIEVEKEKMRLEIELELKKVSLLLKVYSLLEAESGSRYAVYHRLKDIRNKLESVSSAIGSIEDGLD